MNEDLFPQTLSLIGRLLDAGEVQRVRRHVMEAYTKPLQIYFRGTEMAWLERCIGPAEEIVHGFFTSRLEREDFFSKWQASGKQLRHWLRISFANHYLMEISRKHKKERERFGGELPEEEKEGTLTSPARLMDRELARAMIRSAMDEAARRCRERGLEEHWKVFVRKKVDEVGYTELAAELGIDLVRTRRMLRKAKDVFRDCLLENVRAEFATPNVGERTIENEVLAIRRALQE